MIRYKYRPMKRSTVSVVPTFSYWPRWITARRLARWRRDDPAWREALDRHASLAGINAQLDEVD